jgi:hypothetical protein
MSDDLRRGPSEAPVSNVPATAQELLTAEETERAAASAGADEADAREGLRVEARSQWQLFRRKFF